MAKENAARRFRLEDLAQTTLKLKELHDRLKEDVIYLCKAREKYKNLPIWEIEKIDKRTHSVGFNVLEYVCKISRIKMDKEYCRLPVISRLIKEADAYIKCIEELVKD